jgi:hypothetical protein
MLPHNRIQLARDTWQATLPLLPPAIAADLPTAAGDPALFRKYDDTISIARLRIVPDTKAPPYFWSRAKCFYELGVGKYDGSASVLGRVAFLQFTNQKVCGCGHYSRPVSEILKTLAQERPQDFAFSDRSPDAAPMPMLARLYRAGPTLPFFSPNLAAQDLAWLISETLPKFQRLSPAP